MNIPSRRWPGVLGAISAALALLPVVLPLTSGSALAQVVDCPWLRQQIAATSPRHDADLYARAARKQQAHIKRTVAYRQSIGCDREQTGLFGFGSSPRCQQIDARIQEMSANLQALLQTARPPGSDRGDLMARYHVYCSYDDRHGELPARRRAPEEDDPGEREAGLPPPEAGYRRMPLEALPSRASRDTVQPGEALSSAPTDSDATPDTPPVDVADAPARAGPKAVCVKTCDGSFFPAGFSATTANFAALEALCHANCPNAETRLYTSRMDAEIEQSIDRDGKSYTALPNAQRFRKSVNGTCSCRVPGKTWTETLADAEKLYAADHRDVVVTQAISDESARASFSKAAARPLPPATLQTSSRRMGDVASTSSGRVPLGAGLLLRGASLPSIQDTEPPSQRTGRNTDAEASTAERKPRIRIVGPEF